MVVFAAIGAITSAYTLREKHRAYKKPFDDEHEKLLRDVRELKAINYHQTKAIESIIQHMLYGNHNSELEAEKKILERLIDDEGMKYKLGEEE